VAEFQGILIALGYDLGKTGADGNFGTETRSAVRAFQSDNELTPDGVAGPNTWKKALEMIAMLEDKPGAPEEPPTDPVAPSELTIEERLDRLEQAVFGAGGDSDGS
jgi:hypothetical protein